MTASEDPQGDGVVKSILFPDISTLDFNFGDDYQDIPASDWAVNKIGTFEAKIQTFLGVRKKRSNYSFNKDEIPFHLLISLAKDAFGHDGWWDEVIDITVSSQKETEDESGQIRHTLTVESLVKITLKDGTYHTDIGYGKAENMPIKSLAYSKAKKESITDGKKRALQNLKHILFDHEDRLRKGYDIYRDVFG